MNVKIIVSPKSPGSYPPQTYVVLQDGESKLDYLDKCFLENSVFSKKSRYVCISHNNGGRKCGKRIYRMAVSGNRSSLKKTEIGLLMKDIHALKISDLANADIKVSFCCLNRILFYMFNPHYAVRISVWLGTISIILGLLSLYLSWK